VFPNINFKIPSSALTIITPWEMHYSGLRTRFDQVGEMSPHSKVVLKKSPDIPSTTCSLGRRISATVQESCLQIRSRISRDKPVGDCK
jgi:hypothetical protein